MNEVLGNLILPVPQVRCGDGEYPVLSMTMRDGIIMQNDRFNKRIASVDLSNYKIVRRGQLVVGFPINEGVIYPQKVVDAGIMSPAYNVWDIDQSKVDINYLDYCLHSPASMHYYASKLRGSTARRKSMPKEHLLELPIYLPPLDTQRRIAAALDKALSLIVARREQIAVLDKLAKDLFVDMFGDPTTNPKGWTVKPLEMAITHINNGMARRGKNTGGDIVLRLVEVQSGFFDYSSPNRIDLSEAEKLRYLLNDGDVLFARVNGNPENVGRCAIYQDIGEPVFHNDHLIRARFDKGILDGTYATYLLNGAYGRNAFRSRVKTSAGQYTVSQEGINSIEIPYPPIEEQRKYANVIMASNSQKSRLNASLAELEKLYQSLTERAFSGELFE